MSFWVSLPWVHGCVVAFALGFEADGLRIVVLSVPALGSSVDFRWSCVECLAGGSSALLVSLSSGGAW